MIGLLLWFLANFLIWGHIESTKKPYILGVDWAVEGQDLTVYAVRKGDKLIFVGTEDEFKRREFL